MSQETAEKVFDEPFAVAPVFCNGVASAFYEDGLVHVSYYYQHLGPEGETVRTIHFRIVMPVHVLEEARKVVDIAAARAAKKRKALA